MIYPVFALRRASVCEECDGMAAQLQGKNVNTRGPLGEGVASSGRDPWIAGWASDAVLAETEVRLAPLRLPIRCKRWRDFPLSPPAPSELEMIPELSRSGKGWTRPLHCILAPAACLTPLAHNSRQLRRGKTASQTPDSRSSAGRDHLAALVATAGVACEGGGSLCEKTVSMVVTRQSREDDGPSILMEETMPHKAHVGGRAGAAFPAARSVTDASAPAPSSSDGCFANAALVPGSVLPLPRTVSGAEMRSVMGKGAFEVFEGGQDRHAGGSIAGGPCGALVLALSITSSSTLVLVNRNAGIETTESLITGQAPGQKARLIFSSVTAPARRADEPPPARASSSTFPLLLRHGMGGVKVRRKRVAFAREAGNDVLAPTLITRKRFGGI
ncbi:hypothetical protein K438DRAFT_1976237 [Mycena galopus ATCC 62051]|nr:hypothetical protein K438DRAFT_1976237 [Mycena galopus ATCC 62051]